MMRDSLDPEGVKYTVRRWALSKSIDGGPEKVFSELAMPARIVSLRILNDCYGEVTYEPFIDRFTECWIRHSGRIEITAKEVHDWVKETWGIEG